MTSALAEVSITECFVTIIEESGNLAENRNGNGRMGNCCKNGFEGLYKVRIETGPHSELCGDDQDS